MNTRKKLITGFVCFCILPVVAAAWLMVNRVELQYIKSLQVEQQRYLDTLTSIVDNDLNRSDVSEEKIKNVLNKLGQNFLPQGSGIYLVDNKENFLYGPENEQARIKPVLAALVKSGRQKVHDSSGVIAHKPLGNGNFHLFNVVAPKVITEELKQIRWQAGILLAIAVVGMCSGAALVYGYFTAHAARAKGFVHRLELPGAPLPGSFPGGEFADICSVLLDQAKSLQQYESQIEEVKVTDPLTGVFNRRVILAKLKEEVAKRERYKTPLTAIALTVDRYNSVVERFDFAVADEVLCRLTALLQTSLRSHDMVGRLENNLFLVVLPLTPVDNGKLICDRIMEAAEVSYWGHPELQVTITGAAVAPLTVEKALEELEDRIQMEKAKGGNQIFTET